MFPIRSGNIKTAGEEGEGWLLRWEWNGGDGVESMTVQTAEGGREGRQQMEMHS